MKNNPLNGYMPDYDAAEALTRHAPTQGGETADSPTFTRLAVFAASKRSPSKNTQARKRRTKRRRVNAIATAPVNIKRKSKKRKSARKTSINCAKPLTMYRLTLRKSAGSNTPTRFTIFYLIAALP